MLTTSGGPVAIPQDRGEGTTNHPHFGYSAKCAVRVSSRPLNKEKERDFNAHGYVLFFPLGGQTD